MLVCVRCKEENVAGFQPLFEKVFHERGPRPRIREQSPHLLIENVGIAQFPGDRQIQQFVVGTAAPQEE